MTTRQTIVFYTTDTGFAVPTLISVRSLRRWSAVPVAIIAIGFSDQQFDTYAALAKELEVTLHRMTADRTEAFNRPEFNATHVPPSALARFFIPDFIPVGALAETDVLYVDGDTWFYGDPSALLEAPAPAEGLMAAEDQSFFFRKDVGKTGTATRTYFDRLGLAQDAGYFNSGVMKFRASTWAALAPQCLRFLEANLALCTYHDQSALNAVAGPVRVRLSPEWNFQSPYWAWTAQDFVAPKILHFVGSEKPWLGNMARWAPIVADYAAARQAYDSPLFPLRRWNAEEQAAMTRAEERSVLKNRTMFFLRILGRRREFERLVRFSTLVGPLGETA